VFFSGLVYVGLDFRFDFVGCGAGDGRGVVSLGLGFEFVAFEID
jgi:hypothetical protein